MTAIVQTEDLCKRFGRTQVLDRIDLTVEQGSVYGLVGPNGAGKTTTLKILMNIVEASSGRATVLGADSRGLRPAHFQQIGYVADGQEMPGWMTVEYLMAYLRPFYPSWDRDRARELLERFDLPRDRRVKHLSRGMRMKLALAAPHLDRAADRPGWRAGRVDGRVAAPMASGLCTAVTGRPAMERAVDGSARRA